MSTNIEYSPGLAGVPAARTSVCYLDGSVGKLQYRGYPIEVLAERSSFEETTYLLLFGELPSAAQLASFDAELRAERAIDPSIIRLYETLPKTGHPMDALACAVTASGMSMKGDHVKDVAYRRLAAIRLIAKLPTLVAAWNRVRTGKAPIAPNDTLGHAANLLYMLDGKIPEAAETRIMDVALVLHAEHSMNASTFAARVTGSTLADLSAAVTSAIGALSGPLHGGANEEVLAMLRGLTDTSPDGVRTWAKDRLGRKEKVMGFGHREYKVKDPRANCLQTLAVKLFEERGATPLYALAVELEKQMAELVGAKGIYPNVDFYSGIVYEKLEIPVDLFTPVFAIARVSGWLAHLLEQLEDNRIFRPNQVWTGVEDRAYVDIASR